MESKEVKSIHFIGICGTAMASVAALCHERGFYVTGSDANVYPPMSTFLQQRGISLLDGYRETNLDHRPDLIVVGNAIKRGNPEVERMLDERLRYCSLPELVKMLLLPARHSIVVAGTHGKTTTSSLLAWVLDSAGLSPGFLIGGLPHNFPEGGARCGSGPYFVLEGDEYDTAFFDKRSKFVHYRPDTVILNNIEYDHADIFPDLAAVKRAFRQLVALVPRRGLIVANGEDPNVREVVADAPAPVQFFSREDVRDYHVPMPGRHNEMNAAAVATCAKALGLTPEQIQRGFDTFRGVKRRLEVRGESSGITVLDDFAHHPTAVRETIRAIRVKYPGRRVWAVFEPRSNSTRRRVFQQELTTALAEADAVCVARVDRAHELPESERLQPEQIVAQLRAQGKQAIYAADADAIVAALVPELCRGDVIGVFSNGGFGGIHDKLLARLRQNT